MTTTITRHVPPQRFVDMINPLVRAALRSPLHRPLDSAAILLHVTGRRTGQVYDIPVGYVRIDERLLVVTDHTWRANLRGGADLEVTLDGHRRPMHAELVEEPQAVAATVLEIIDRHGLTSAESRLGLAFHPEQVPEEHDLVNGVQQLGISFVVLTPVAG
jgi:hypothetical protein